LEGKTAGKDGSSGVKLNLKSVDFVKKPSYCNRFVAKRIVAKRIVCKDDLLAI